MRRRRPAGLALLAALSILVVTQPAALAADSTATGGSATSVSGPTGVVLSLDSASRTPRGVRLVLTLANRRSVMLAAYSYESSTGAPLEGIALWNPETGRSGTPLGAITGSASGEAAASPTTGAATASCSCGHLPSFLQPGTQASFVIDVADPGGSTVDLQTHAFQPVVGIHLAGHASSTASRTFSTRSRQLLQRTALGAARTSSGAGVNQVDLATDVLFAFDSSTLSPQAGAALDTAATALKAQSGRHVGVYGHTDSQGSADYNQGLSLRRAQAVQAALAQRLGSGWTFDVAGKGESEPVASEVNPDGTPDTAGQALNRRVQVKVLS